MAIDRRLFASIDWTLLLLMFALFSLGLVNLYSASGVRGEDGLILSGFYQKQFYWGLLGMVGLTVFTLFDYQKLKSLAWPLFWVAVLLLALVPVMGKTVMGAKRWLAIGPATLQPSEVAKLAMLLLTARVLSQMEGRLDFRGLGFMLGLGLIPAAQVIVQPDLGSGLNILMILGGMILFRGLTKPVFVTLLTLAPIIPAVGWRFMKEYQKKRVLTFIDPSNDPLGSGYHILQSQIAIGSGQTWGKGWLQGTQSQLRFLPEKHTDFAVAVFGEEWGFVGMMTLLTLYCLFLWRLARIASEAKDPFGSFLAAGVFFYFFWQILINMGMVLGLMPVVGIPLPFISYGGSGTLVNFCLVGLALNVGMRRFVFHRG